MMSKEKRDVGDNAVVLCLLEDLAAGTMMSACMMVASRVESFKSKGTLGLASRPRCVGVGIGNDENRSLGRWGNGRGGRLWSS